MILSSDTPPALCSLREPDHLCVFKSGESSSHSGSLTPVAIRNHKGHRSFVIIKKNPAQSGGIISGVQHESSPFGNIKIAEVKATVLPAMNAQFTVGQDFKGKRTGCGGLLVFATMHHEHETCFKYITGNPLANAKVIMHSASAATLASF
jgi:hypothetical protein